MKVAIPLADGKLTPHFGHCEIFAIMSLQDDASMTIISKEEIKPPPHAPGVIPKWLASLEVEIVIASGIGVKAQKILNDKGIKVISGAMPKSPEDLIFDYVSGFLMTDKNACTKGNEIHKCGGK